MFKGLNMLLTGIILGVLFAPQKGTDTRKKLLGVFEDVKDNAKDALQQAADKAKSGIDSAKDKIAKI